MVSEPFQQLRRPNGDGVLQNSQADRHLRPQIADLEHHGHASREVGDHCGHGNGERGAAGEHEVGRGRDRPHGGGCRELREGEDTPPEGHLVPVGDVQLDHPEAGHVIGARPWPGADDGDLPAGPREPAGELVRAGTARLVGTPEVLVDVRQAGASVRTRPRRTRGSGGLAHRVPDVPVTAVQGRPPCGRRLARCRSPPRTPVTTVLASSRTGRCQAWTGAPDRRRCVTDSSTASTTRMTSSSVSPDPLGSATPVRKRRSLPPVTNASARRARVGGAWASRGAEPRCPDHRGRPRRPPG